MLIALIMGIFTVSPVANAMDVAFLTHGGALNLKSWTEADLKKIAKKSGEISAQKLFFDESAQSLELNDRADIDLVVLYGSNGHVARVPRFMVWRNYLKLQLARDGSLNSSAVVSAVSGRLLVPPSLFTVSKIQKIELTSAAFLYPDNELHTRTNPAASRGEKLFAQSCMACHGLTTTPKIKPESITDAQLNAFSEKHRSQGIALDAKALRGLVAYRDALSTERSEVKSKK